MYHPHHHQERPDLDDCILEDRTLPASFLESTFFEPPAFSETTPFTGGLNPAIDTVSWGMFFTAPTNSASYYGFGSNPFGLGLDPLSGVVSAYSIDSALSNILGAGSSMPGSEATIVTTGLQNTFGIPGVSATDVQSLASTITAGPTTGYGSAFSTGFSFSINSTNSFGMGPNVVGNMAAAQGSASPAPPYDIGDGEAGDDSEKNSANGAAAAGEAALAPEGLPAALPDSEAAAGAGPWDPGIPDR